MGQHPLAPGREHHSRRVGQHLLERQVRRLPEPARGRVAGEAGVREQMWRSAFARPGRCRPSCHSKRVDLRSVVAR
jgi:hypothetical protein